ncbi:hypothetical protein LMG27952_03444 [Paraburkholderia hiiakae]|uniref:Lauroyl/myristoyl acyltransferase n=1 Tax=Paraburkholderia hiiakae TaxID=1081782 RepID=A0ABN7I0E8_9BURK|nr:hypothetical protein [Paraburkholderia hiiakae]CAD6539061.1 hypothetical protein LMG27952_03444 [Paraburkholderia hiiakae]
MISMSLKHLRTRFLRMRLALRRQVLARLPLSMVGHAALLCWLALASCNGRVRSAGIARYDAGRHDVGLARREALRTLSASMRETLLDECLYAGRALARDRWSDMQAVAAELAWQIRWISANYPERPIVLSPFHFVSQYANIYVVDEVRKMLNLASVSVVSGVPRDVYGNDAAMIPALRVLYTYDEGGSGSRNGLGLRVARSLRREGLVVVFADVAPFSLAKFPMETVGVLMKGRPARLHNGVFRLGAPFDALLFSFYLRFDNGRFSVRMFEPVALAQADAPQRLADLIETARIENYSHWLFAGHPSTYHFAPTR